MDPKAPGADCEHCTLVGEPLVLSEKNEPAFIFAIGEGPGQVEAQTGKPFTGKAGRLLDSTLSGRSLKRRGCWITNAVLCRPPENRTPTSHEIDCCRNRLMLEILQADPKVILVLGNTAVESIFQEHIGIKGLRGKAYLLEIDRKDYLVVPTLHPAAILRVPQLFEEFDKDIGIVKTLLSRSLAEEVTTEITFQAPNHIIPETIEEALTQIETLMTYKEVAADLETSGYDPKASSILCASLSGNQQDGIVISQQLLQESPVREALAKLLSKARLAGHNSKFDAKHLKVQGFPWSFEEDTLLMHYALDERRGSHGLKELSHEHLAAPDYESEVRRYITKRTDSFEVVPKPVLYKYAAWDAVLTARLREKLRTPLREEGRVSWLYENILVPASRVLVDVELHGFKLDGEVRSSLREQYDNKLTVLEQQIRQTTSGRVTNPSSTHQVAEELKSIPQMAKFRTEGGGISTNKEALEAIKDLHPLASLLLDYRHLRKMRSTYLEITPDTEGYTHADFFLFGTVTGRTTARNPGILTIPRESLIRNLFCASPGRVLLQADAQQAELRVLAFLSQDPYLLQVFEEGKDLHDEVTRLLYGKAVETATKDRLKDMRMDAKIVNFGIAYGITEYGLSERTKWSVPEARVYLDRFYAKARGLRQWMERQGIEAINNGYVESPFGRRRRFKLVTPEVREEIRKAAVNTPTQGTASDITLLAAIELNERLGEKADLVNLIYDALVFDVRIEDLPEVAQEVKQVFESIPKRFLDMKVPYPVDLEVGTHWGSLEKYKIA